MKDDMFHYVECGLDEIWLLNGFGFHDTPRGRAVSIKNMESLHDAIGAHFCREKRNLTGPEIRFLRQEMQLSQAVLARLLEVKELTIHRWEAGKNQAPRAAEALIRFLYLEQVEKRAGKIRDALKRIADLEDGIDRQQELVFSLSGGDGHNWELAA